MKIKTLLLGSAAVLMATGTAHATAAGGGTAAKPTTPAATTAAPAAGAAAAKPTTTTAAPAAAAATVKPVAVAFVTVCDAFGLGYFIIPGQKDTCVRVQGQVTFQLNFHTRDTEGVYGGTTSPHEAGWDTQVTGQVTFTAKRMTDHGDLQGVIRITGSSNNTTNVTLAGGGNGGAGLGLNCVVATAGNTVCRVPTDQFVKMNQIFIKLGGFEAGYDGSVFGAGTTKQLSYTWDLPNRTTLAVGLDDPRDRWGSRLPRYYWFPDVVTSLAQTTAWGTWGAAAGVANVSIPASGSGAGASGFVWGVALRTTINVNALNKGDQLTFNGSFGTGGQFVGGAPATNGNVLWQAVAQIKHIINPQLNTTWRVTYSNAKPAAPTTVTQETLVWTPYNVNGIQVQNTFTANQTLGVNPLKMTFADGLQIQFAY